MDLADLWARLASDLSRDFQDIKDRVRIDIGIETVCSDEELLYQLLNQIIRNALSYTGDSAIEVDVQATSDQLRMTVRDHGSGLPQDTASLFEPFSQGEVRRSRGLGLGLSIAFRICQALGGQLEAGNHPEGGAVFEIQLPMDPVS